MNVPVGIVPGAVGGDRRQFHKNIGMRRKLDCARPWPSLSSFMPFSTPNRMAAKLRSFGSPVTLRAYPRIGHIGIILSLAPGLRAMTSLRADMLDFIAATTPTCRQ